MKAARFTSVGKIELRDEPTPEIPEGELLVKTKASGICGTDYHIFSGSVRGLAQPGVVLGHEFSGVVEGVGPNVLDFTIGDRIAVDPNLFCGACHYCRNAKKHFCENWTAIGIGRDGGFQEQVLVPTQAAYKIPDKLDYSTAAFLEPMACVLHSVRQAKVQVGETVVVQGAGAIGQLFVQVLARAGVGKIIVSETDHAKLNLAKQNGASVAVDVTNEQLQEVVKAETDGIGAQVMFDAAGLASTIPTAIDILENTGRVVLFGVPPEKSSVTFYPYDVYRKELQISGSFTNPYTNEAAVNILDQIDVKPLLTDKISLEEIVERGFNQFGTKGVLKIQVQF